ncbi:hypothetical protein D039_0561A, partial [Vibrio parahaemolyticus EKP-028]
MHSCDKSR